MGFLRSNNTALSRIQQELNNLMSLKPWDDADDEPFTLGADWVPAVDVKTEKGHYLVRADLPGVNPDDIDIRLDNELLTIQGRRADEKRTEENGYQRVERFSGSFVRRMTLPGSGDADNVKAKVRNGVLEVTIPRHEPKVPKRITVSS